MLVGLYQVCRRHALSSYIVISYIEVGRLGNLSGYRIRVPGHYYPRGNDLRLHKLRVRYDLRTYVNLVFPTRWLIHGKVYLTGLFLLIPLTH